MLLPVFAASQKIARSGDTDWTIDNDTIITTKNAHIQISPVTGLHQSVIEHREFLCEDGLGEFILQLASNNSGFVGSGILFTNQIDASNARHWIAQNRASVRSNDFTIGYYASTVTGDNIAEDATDVLVLETDGDVGIGIQDPNSFLQIKAGTTTKAPLKFTSGTNLTSPQAGAVEWDGTRLYATQTTGPTRKTIAYTDEITGGTDDQNASEVAMLDAESVFDSTTVEGALEELDEMSRNKFFYIANTATLPLAKGNTTVILDGALTPFTATFTTTNLRVGDEVKVSCFNGSVTLDSSSGGFIRPTVGTNESTIPIDAAGYILVWDGTNFYKVN